MYSLNRLQMTLHLIISLWPSIRSQDLPSVATIESNVDSQPNLSLIANSIQQISHRLSLIEAESHQQTTALTDISRTVARVEGHRQDVISSIDRSESRISQRLDAIKGDLSKVITLQEVIRDDLNKLEQEQIASKIWLSEQMRSLSKRNVRPQEIQTKQILDIVGSDSVTNLQTTLDSVKRSSNVIEEQLTDLTVNVAALLNDTDLLVNNSRNYVESNSFNKAIRNLLEGMKRLEKPNFYIRSHSSDTNESQMFPKDCKEIQDNQELKNLSGVYRIQPTGSDGPIFVFCDMKIDGGGWTVIQSRQDGSVDFYRDWYEYKYGFGNIASEFWLGNDNIHRITYQNIYELRIDLEDFEGEKAFAKYTAFAIGSESENYMVKLLGAFEGDAGDAMSYHISMPFSTKDRDNDQWTDHCAVEHTGGWWYNQCETANLNGQYLAGLSPQEYKGIYWSEWQGPSYSLKKVDMKLRPVGR